MIGIRMGRRAAALLLLPAAQLVAQQAPHAGHGATAAPPTGGYVPADVAFMQGMIGHHAQALVMTELLRTRTRTPAMLALAERIAVSQRDEIQAMARWLRVRALPVPDTTGHGAHQHGGDHAMMPGMLSAAQLDTLAAARGGAFDRLFLRYMIQHHEGALSMVASLFATDGAAYDSQLNSFATDVDADQRAEIGRMAAMLQARRPARAPSARPRAVPARPAPRGATPGHAHPPGQ